MWCCVGLDPRKLAIRNALFADEARAPSPDPKQAASEGHQASQTLGIPGAVVPLSPPHPVTGMHPPIRLAAPNMGPGSAFAAPSQSCTTSPEAAAELPPSMGYPPATPSVPTTAITTTTTTTSTELTAIQVCASHSLRWSVAMALRVLFSPQPQEEVTKARGQAEGRAVLGVSFLRRGGGGGAPPPPNLSPKTPPPLHVLTMPLIHRSREWQTPILDSRCSLHPLLCHPLPW